MQLHNNLLLVIACWLFSTENGHAKTLPTSESFSLKNGLEVIVLENHRVPAVNHTIWYRVGAGDDPVGKSGLAHYHEHAMFLGTAKYKAGEYSKIIASHGGEENAFTTHDATAYFINIAKEELPLAMEMEADRMRGLSPSDADMAKEKQVIIEERRMRIENNPEALLAEQVRAVLFRNHPYHIPVIGWLHEMEGLTKQDVLDFHNKYYHPNNAVLIISGDITVREVKPLVEKYYGKLPQIHVPAHNWIKEPPQNSQRRVSMLSAQITVPTWSRVYEADSLGYGKSEETLPLFILAQVLGGGKSSRLYNALVTEQKIATNVSVDYNGFSKGAGEFSIEISPAHDSEHKVEIADLEKAVDVEIAKLVENGLSDDEFVRAKTLLKADTIFARDGLSAMASIMGWVRMIGLNANYFSRWETLVNNVSKDSVLESTKDNLKKEQSVTAVLLPIIPNEKVGK
jgi:zinc protease